MVEKGAWQWLAVGRKGEEQITGRMQGMGKETNVGKVDNEEGESKKFAADGVGEEATIQNGTAAGASRNLRQKTSSRSKNYRAQTRQRTWSGRSMTRTGKAMALLAKFYEMEGRGSGGGRKVRDDR